MCAVRPIKKIRAFSRNAVNREAFASRMSQRLDVEVTPVRRPPRSAFTAQI